MIMGRGELEDNQHQIRNTPIRLRDWRELLESDDVASIEGPDGTLALVEQDGQLNLHYGFSGPEEMRYQFEELFNQLSPEIDTFDAQYVRIDLVQVPDRNWIEPLLHNVDFRDFGGWIDMIRADLDHTAPPPEFPPGIEIRRAEPEDADRIVEIELAAYGDFSDGEMTTRQRLESALWTGVLLRGDQVVAYAINGPVELAHARILSAAVDPSESGNGFGKIVSSAAIYQLTASDARSAIVRVRQEMPQALKVAQDLGFTPGHGGMELRRPVDEQEIIERRQQERYRGMKARFGDWR